MCREGREAVAAGVRVGGGEGVEDAANGLRPGEADNEPAEPRETSRPHTQRTTNGMGSFPMGRAHKITWAKLFMPRKGDSAPPFLGSWPVDAPQTDSRDHEDAAGPKRG